MYNEVLTRFVQKKILRLFSNIKTVFLVCFLLEDLRIMFESRSCFYKEFWIKLLYYLLIKRSDWAPVSLRHSQWRSLNSCYAPSSCWVMLFTQKPEGMEDQSLLSVAGSSWVMVRRSTNQQEHQNHQSNVVSCLQISSDPSRSPQEGLWSCRGSWKSCNLWGGSSRHQTSLSHRSSIRFRSGESGGSLRSLWCSSNSVWIILLREEPVLIGLGD